MKQTPFCHYCGKPLKPKGKLFYCSDKCEKTGESMNRQFNDILRRIKW